MPSLDVHSSPSRQPDDLSSYTCSAKSKLAADAARGPIPKRPHSTIPSSAQLTDPIRPGMGEVNPFDI